MAGYFPAVPHTAIRTTFCRLYLIIEYRPVLMMYGFEYALLGAHLGAAGELHSSRMRHMPSRPKTEPRSAPQASCDHRRLWRDQGELEEA